MAVAGITGNLSSYIQSLYAKSSTKSAGSADETGAVSAAEEMSEEEKLEAFKKEIWDEINSFSWNKSMNISIQITDGAFKRMMEDSDFKNRMLSVIQKESIAAQPPGNVSLTWIDESGYRGYSYIDNDAGDIAFKAHSNHKDSFFVQKAKDEDDLQEIWLQWHQERKEQRELLEEEYERTQYLNSVYNHKADIARLYEEKTIVNWSEGEKDGSSTYSSFAGSNDRI